DNIGIPAVTYDMYPVLATIKAYLSCTNWSNVLRYVHDILVANKNSPLTDQTLFHNYPDGLLMQQLHDLFISNHHTCAFLLASDGAKMFKGEREACKYILYRYVTFFFNDSHV